MDSRSCCASAPVGAGTVPPALLRIVLVSTYELGHQAFGLASPAAWLRREGFEVLAIDLSRQALNDDQFRSADLIAFHVPMHTATRMSIDLLGRIRKINPTAHLCFYGLYAPINEGYLRRLGVGTILGGEFEAGLVGAARRLSSGSASAPQQEAVISTDKQAFILPDRSGLPRLSSYAAVLLGQTRLTVGYVEASRGCKHLCRHCPVVPVYQGRFRVVAAEVVLADIGQQVRAGAQHITIGDPDFFNGPTHAMRIVELLHRAYPGVTYDVTIKVEHLLQHRALLPMLRDTGCLFVTSAVESIDDEVLALLDKGHTHADFVEALGLMEEAGLTLSPTFVAFHPWTTVRKYRELLAAIENLGLVDYVGSIQLAVRLLIPAGSELLKLPEVRRFLAEFDEARLCFPWVHPQPEVDQLYEDVLAIIETGLAGNASRREIFNRIGSAAAAADTDGSPLPSARQDSCATRPVPQLTEPWFCCSEPPTRMALLHQTTSI